MRCRSRRSRSILSLCSGFASALRRFEAIDRRRAALRYNVGRKRSWEGHDGQVVATPSSARSANDVLWPQREEDSDRVAIRPPHGQFVFVGAILVGTSA